MLRGHGPGILQAVPKDHVATATQILADLEANAICRAPGATTLRRHLRDLEAMGCIAHYPNGTYRRLVDSEFDLPLEAPA